MSPVEARSVNPAPTALEGSVQSALHALEDVRGEVERLPHDERFHALKAVHSATGSMVALLQLAKRREANEEEGQ